MNPPIFIRSYYSLLSSLCSPRKVLEKVKEFGYRSIALVDFNVLSGVKTFKKLCDQEGIQLVIGLEFEVETQDDRYQVVLLAKNDNGFRNLIQISSLINAESITINPEIINQYRNDCFLILMSDNMPLTSYIDKGLDISEGLRAQESVFPDSIIALNDHDKAANAGRSRVIRSFAREHNLHTIAYHHCFYPEKSDLDAYMALKAVKEKKTIDDNSLVIDQNRHYLSPNEIEYLYDRSEIYATEKLFSLCGVNLNLSTDLPVYQTPPGVSPKDYLTALCREGLRRRLKGHNNQLYTDRLRYELKIINDMNFTNYFLIVYDFVLHAKKKGILVGPGRGSGVASLAAYCLGITNVDPIRYGLIFERFLNPERITMPDFDIDFPDNRRDEVIAYVKEKYGSDHVAHIITYGTLKPKQALRDIGRVYQFSNRDIDSLTKLIPNDPHIVTMTDALNASKAFKRRIESEERYRNLLNVCLRIEGFPRHESTHASGIVLSKEKLTDVVPIISIEEDLCSVQYTMEHLEEMGLIKIDFLGLRNLSIISEIVDDIRTTEEFNLNSISLSDPKTFSIIGRGDTLGVFQLESAGMTNLVRKLKPSIFEEIAMAIALFRPGPMENIPKFLENHEHPESVTYLHEDLRPILKETYGIIVYQEQILSIARKIAGFTYGKADVLRRAMSKKKEKELIALHDDFINGCLKNRYSKETAEEIYALILKFADYGFNKSHSVVYALIAYQMAYLKANYPLYFYKALLNGVISSELKTYQYIGEIQKNSIKILAPDLNRSSLFYRIENGCLRMPFAVIKEVGNSSASSIVKERDDNGPYKSYEDALRRLNGISIGKNVIQNLIAAGAFDCFGLTRETMIRNYDNVAEFASKIADYSLFNSDFDPTPQLITYSDKTQHVAEREKEVFGFYFSVNPIIQHKKDLGIDCPTLLELQNIKGYVKGFGHIDRIKEHKTKNGEWMAFADISDGTADYSLAIMPNLYRQHETELAKEKYISFSGKSDKDGSCLVRELSVLE